MNPPTKIKEEGDSTLLDTARGILLFRVRDTSVELLNCQKSLFRG